MEEFNSFKERKAKEISDLKKRWNDKFLSDMKESRRVRILSMQNIATLVIGLFAAGFFVDSLKGTYGVIGFALALITLVFIVLYLRESFDNDQEGDLKLFVDQRNLYEKFDNILSISENKKQYDALIGSLLNEVEDNSNKKYPIDCSGEFINFLFISTLALLTLSFFEVEFKYCYLTGIILLSLTISFLKVAHLIILPFSYILKKVRRFDSNKHFD